MDCMFYGIVAWRSGIGSDMEATKKSIEAVNLIDS